MCFDKGLTPNFGLVIFVLFQKWNYLGIYYQIYYMVALLKWWLVFVLIIGFLMASTSAGWTYRIISNDDTFLSLIILAVGLISSIYAGVLNYRFAHAERVGSINKVESIQRHLKVGNLCASTCARLGMIGTVIGFIAIVSGLGGLNASDPASLQEALASMSAGIGVALYTTLVGLVWGLLITIQYFILGRAIEEFING
jgi:hypothetical protein